jgi:hypothetical protein
MRRLLNLNLLLAISPLLAWTYFARAADVDPIRDRLEKAKATYESRLEILRKDVLADLDKSENQARQIPDKKRIDEIKAQSAAFQSTGQLPTPLNPQLQSRIRGTRSALEKEYVAARDAYLKAKQDDKADAMEKELQQFRKGIPAEPIDLLKLIDVKRDTIRGRWETNGSSIVSADAGYNSIQIPFQPPREYVLELIVAKVQAGNDFQIALVVGEQRCTVVFDGNGDQASGISAIDGRPFDNNETTVHGTVLSANSPIPISATVHKEALVIDVAGKSIIDWKGNPKHLTLGQDPAGTDPRFLFLAVQKGARYRIDSIKLRPLQGEGILAPPPSR